MQSLVILLFIAAVLSEYLVSIGAAPGVVQYTPEVLSVIALVYVILKGPQDRFENVRFAYWFVFGTFALTLAFGALIEKVSPGPIFAGIRNFCAPLPFFFLPSVYAFSNRQVRLQLLVLLALCLVQLPIAYHQRMSGFRVGEYTGDYTMGTLMGSGVLSIFLIASASVLTAFLMRRRLKLVHYVVLLALVLAPTTLNETKVTLFLVPVALVTVVYFGSQSVKRLRNLMACLLLLTAFSAAYVVVYDYFVAPRWHYGLMDFFAQEGRVEGYLYKESEVGAEKAGRVDTLVVPLRELSKNATSLAFGLGLGNASDSALGPAYVGQYFRRFDIFAGSTVSVLLLETGLIGLVCALIVLVLVLQDSRRIADNSDTLFGALALGMIGVTCIYFVSIFYASIHISVPLAYVFTYYSGLIAAHRMRTLDARASTVDGTSGVLEAEQTLGSMRAG